MEEKDAVLHRILKVTYLSVQKFAISLNNVPEDKIQEKMSILLEYLEKKEKECLQIEEEMKKEEKRRMEESVVELVDFLGRRGFIKTAKLIQKENLIEDLVDIEKYVKIKESLKQAIEKGPSDKPVEITDVNNEVHGQMVYRAVISREFVRLCECDETKNRASKFAKAHKESLSKEILLLLVLPAESLLFTKIANSYKNEKITECLNQAISTKDSNCYFYQRVAMGISGFTTPACKETDSSDCPGCSRDMARIAENAPKSMRSSSRPLCTFLQTPIPSGHSTYITNDGDVYSEYGSRMAGYSTNQKSASRLKKCYFV